ncbi:L-threonylcarbamoyladenylate synthase [Halarsenatibacter silvermanii]|uniref:L-threonylcarbamoyladenylate synthase n=1 Tax=Halarsenatibacter silvermanii TaxID=321763 RepID=UPI00190EAAE2|nr:L-threonylcarbamoyladenylate synthase [Halarsenatibacter silvermanii]
MKGILQTEVLEVDTGVSPGELLGTEAVKKASSLLQRGELVAFPTETVYGLGANALDERAVRGIFAAKDRPEDNPLIVHVYSREELNRLTRGTVPSAVRQLTARFWPGPLTVILPRSDEVPGVICAGLDTVAVRMPSHPVARAILTRSGLPVAAPSANKSGLPSPTRAEHVLADMEGSIPLILDGGECPIGVESTVLDMTSEIPKILRPGGISASRLREALGRDAEIERCYDVTPEDNLPRSPGMKYRHYAPSARLELLEEGSPEEIWKYAGRQRAHSALLVSKATGQSIAESEDVAVYSDPERGADQHIKPVIIGSEENMQEIAHNLFTYLRSLDDEGRKLIMVEAINEEGLGEAIMNRLRKAATEIISLDPSPEK